MANINEVFTRTIGKKESAKTESCGFFGRNAKKIFKVFTDHAKIGPEKMDVSLSQFTAVMDVIDNINAAKREVVEIDGGRRLDDLYFYDALKDAFFGPRDVRFTKSALRSPNLIVNTDCDVVESNLTWVEFNEIIDYLKEKSNSSILTYSAMGREAIHGDLELLQKRMLIISDGNDGSTFDPADVRFYVPRDAENLLSPVMVTPAVAKLLYKESKFIDDVDEFSDEYIDALRAKFSTK